MEIRQCNGFKLLDKKTIQNKKKKKKKKTENAIAIATHVESS